MATGRGSFNLGSRNSSSSNGGGGGGKSSWSEAKFLSTVPAFLKNDPDVLRMAEETRYEEERRKRLEEEVKGKIIMEGISSMLTPWNRRSGF